MAIRLTLCCDQTGRKGQVWSLGCSGPCPLGQPRALGKPFCGSIIPAGPGASPVPTPRKVPFPRMFLEKGPASPRIQRLVNSAASYPPFVLRLSVACQRAYVYGYKADLCVGGVWVFVQKPRLVSPGVGTPLCNIHHSAGSSSSPPPVPGAGPWGASHLGGLQGGMTPQGPVPTWRWGAQRAADWGPRRAPGAPGNGIPNPLRGRGWATEAGLCFRLLSKCPSCWVRNRSVRGWTLGCRNEEMATSAWRHLLTSVLEKVSPTGREAGQHINCHRFSPFKVTCGCGCVSAVWRC